MPDSTREQNRREKLIQLVDLGADDKDLILFDRINDLEDKVEEEIPSMREVITRMKGDKGEKGDNGEKAVINYPVLIEEIVSRIPAPENGKDAVVDYEKIIRAVVNKIPIPLDGVSPEVDYDFILLEVLSQLPEIEDGKDGSPDTPEQVTEKINASSKKIKKEQIEGLADIERIAKASAQSSSFPVTTTHFLSNGTPIGRAKNINFIGAILSQSGDQMNVTFSGGGFTLLSPTGSVNSVNTAFIFTSKPVYIVSDGAWYRENKGWTWNSGTLTATMTIPPNDDLYGFA